MAENRTCPNCKWEEIPTAELDKILQFELEKEQPDERVVLPILKEIGDREKDYPVKREETIDLGKKLKTDCPKRTTGKRNWVIAASAAAVLCIVMALPRTVGAESIFGALFRWTSGVFQFVDPDGEKSRPEVDNTFKTDNPGLQKLYEEVTNHGADEEVVPTWLPDGYELLSLKIMDAPSGTKINALFGMEGLNTITLTYRVTSTSDLKFEKEDSAVEVMEYSNVSHFILENNDNITVTWNNKNTECLMITSNQKETVYLIIKSIYGRVLK